MQSVSAYEIKRRMNELQSQITALMSSFGRAFHAENVSRAGKRRYENFLFKWRQL